MSLFQGCQKEKFSDQTPTETEKTDATTLISTPRNFTMPVNDNGILRFTDRQHLWDYVEYLENAIDGAGADTDTVDMDSVLYAIERSIHFHSFRQKEIDDDVLYSFSHPTEYFAQDYIGDPILKSIFNEYSEFWIGDDLFVYFAPNYTIQIYNNIPIHQEEIRLLDKGDEHNIPYATFGNDMKLDEYSPVYEVHSINGVGVIITPTPYDVCAAGPTIQTINVRITGAFVPDVDYEINWGDNTENEHVFGPSSGLTVSHTYSPGGTFVIEVGATRVSNGNSLGFCKIGVDVSTSCSRSPDQECFWVEGIASDGKTPIAINGELKGFPVGFGTLDKAYLRTWVFEEGDWWEKDHARKIWRRRRGSLTITLNGAVSDNTCSVTDTKTRFKHRIARTLIARTRFWNGDHNTPIDGTVTATYSGGIRGVILSANLVLDICDDHPNCGM